MIRLATITAILALIAGPIVARADDTAVSSTLPGVSTETYSIVKPLSEPDEGVPPDPKTYKVGDTEVKISGMVRYQIDFGSKPDRKR